MSSKQHELELLLLTMFSAVPLYGTAAISITPLIVFHVVMLLLVLRVATGHDPELIPLPLMRVLAVAYILFYIVDAAVISRSAIAASTHLVLFIAAYQPMEPVSRRKESQRLLTAALIFVASVATSTHIAIVPFVIAFAFLLFRELIHLSHADSVQTAGVSAAEPPSGRAAAFYVFGTTAIGILLFPMLPRVRNPFVPGFIGSLNNASTGLSDTINFNDSGDASNNTYTLDGTKLTRPGMADITVTAVETVVLNTGTGVNTIEVVNTGASTTTFINGNANVDTITIDNTGTGSFLGLRLYRPASGDAASGIPGSPAYGAQVTITTADGHTQIAQLDGGGGHSGKRSFDVFFGLGSGGDKPVSAKLSWRDVDGTVHSQTLSLNQGWHSIVLGGHAQEVQVP